jgi:pimeloyl-ACP methyl ester carboxylesterase
VVFEPQFHALRYLTTPLARTFVRMNVARLQRNPRRAVDVFYEWAFADRHGGNGWKDLPDTDKQRFYANTSAILGAFAPHPFNALMEPISTRKIRDGGVPIGYILGEDSNPFFDHIHAKLVGQIPVTRTIRVPGAAHMLPIEAPAAFADAVRQAIGSSTRD